MSWKDWFQLSKILCERSVSADCAARGKTQGSKMVNNVNGVFYATTYHPIQAGSIDGTDVTAHDKGVYRALLGSATGLYDPLRDPKADGDPYCSLFVGRLSAQTDEKSLREAMSKFGRVKNLRLVRHIVTGASRGYAFVEFETEKDMRVAYEGAHLSKLDGASILVDYNRQQLMPGWIPRRLGGGLGGKKESGQLRFGGRDRPFRAPLKPIPHDELRKLGIPLPPEGRYMTRFQVPPLPQRRHSTNDGSFNNSESKHHRVHSMEEDDLRVKDKDSSEAHGSEAGEERERDRHRRRRDEISDRVDGDYLETESRSYRKHRFEERGQESRREYKYDGYEFEPKRVDSNSHRDEQKDEERRGERVERKRRKEQSSAHHQNDDEVRKRHRRRHSQDDTERSAERSERRNRNLDYYTERSFKQREPDLEQSRSSRDAELGDAHRRHRESRYQSEDQNDHWQPTEESDKKHRDNESKHRRRHREQGSPHDDEGKHHRSSRKHRHRERPAGENLHFEEKEKKRSKHREHDI